MGYPIGGDGAFRAFTTDEIRAFELKTADVKNGAHPSISLEPTGGAAVRRSFFCKWSKRDDVIAYFLGAAGVVGSGTNISLSRAMPLAPLAGAQWLNYIAVAIESMEGAGDCGVDDADGVPTYPKCRFTVRFEQVFFKLAADDPDNPEYNRYVEILPGTTETNYLSLPGSTLFYLRSGGVPAGSPHLSHIPYNVGRPETTSKVGFKWWRLPRDVWQPGSQLYKRIKGDPNLGTGSYIGTVNKTTFKGRPPGTLMFAGVDEEIVPDLVSGTWCTNLTMNFLEKNTGNLIDGAGWNYLWFQAPPNVVLDPTGYYLVGKGPVYEANGSLTPGKYLYAEKEFADLFVVGAIV